MSSLTKRLCKQIERDRFQEGFQKGLISKFMQDEGLTELTQLKIKDKFGGPVLPVSGVVLDKKTHLFCFLCPSGQEGTSYQIPFTAVGFLINGEKEVSIQEILESFKENE